MNKYDEDFYDGNNAGKMIAMGIAGVSFVAFILLFTFYMNMGGGKTAVDGGTQSPAETQTEEQAVEGEEAQAEPDRKLTSDQLDFWDMYDYKEQEEKEARDKKRVEELLREQQEKEQEEKDREDYESAKEEIARKKEQKEEEETLMESGVSQPADKDGLSDSAYAGDGEHTQVEKEDGSVQWVEILESVPKHEYDFDNNLSLQNSVMKYYKEGRLSSKFGIDVSGDSGDIDWNRVRDAGVEFAMIRVGTRGYQTGAINLDEKFVQNMDGALGAGVKAGVYFCSQATSTQEAVEEANFVVGAISRYNITYPVVCHMEYVPDEAARTDNLTADQRTQFAMDFCSAVKSWGYKTMVEADKNWLVTKLDLTTLSGCDVWLSQPGEKPDYPYQFQMWRYSETGRIDGIEADTGLNISFVDYEMR